tara:strand:- start:543 stop:866 length:324 start_codon:yes stop_codon:yes gene_type:complete
MNKYKQFIRDTGILFEYLPYHIRNKINYEIEKFKRNRRTFFKISRSPKLSMNASLILSIISIVLDAWYFALFFFVLYLIFALYKIWISGEPMVWYKDKYMVKDNCRL